MDFSAFFDHMDDLLRDDSEVEDYRCEPDPGYIWVKMKAGGQFIMHIEMDA